MRLVILDDYDLASEWAAKYIRNRIIQFKPSADRYFTLGLPTGKQKTSLFPAVHYGIDPIWTQSQNLLYT